MSESVCSAREGPSRFAARLFGLFLPLALALFLGDGAHGQVSCPGSGSTTYYPLYCRGPLPVQLYGSASDSSSNYYIIPFTPNTTAAGTTGETLADGTCAWS